MDVVALGDAMISFSPPGASRLEQAYHIEVRPTRAEANAAVAMAIVWQSALDFPCRLRG